jgi:hypothetical protein
MTTTQQKTWLGTFATIFGCLAVAAAVLPTWVLPLVLPPEPVDKVVIDLTQSLKNRLAAKASGKVFKEPERKANWYQIFSVVAVSLGVGALVFSALSFITHEPLRFAVAGATLGVGAIIFQVSLFIAFALIGILLIAVILNTFGVSL